MQNTGHLIHWPPSLSSARKQSFCQVAQTLLFPLTSLSFPFFFLTFLSLFSSLFPSKFSYGSGGVLWSLPADSGSKPWLQTNFALFWFARCTSWQLLKVVYVYEWVLLICQVKKFVPHLTFPSIFQETYCFCLSMKWTSFDHWTKYWA